jgi:hypothetical protein
MPKKVAIFWPGEAELALPSVEEATVQLERALRQARARRRTASPGFLAKPHEAIEKLGPVDDPMVGVCVHWFYGPHTTDGVVGKDNPLLLASNFSGRWPGLVGLLNTGACLESGRPPLLARLDGLAGLDEGPRLHGPPRRVVPTGAIAYAEDEIAYHAPVSPRCAAPSPRRSPPTSAKRASS